MDYKTAAGTVRSEFVEKRSKFIATLSPAKTPDEAKSFISAVQTEFFDARHHVFAYRTQTSERFSDDGEPQGTAGMPVLEVIRRSGLMNVAVVVARYFGGILLGAPGLLRAYSHAASLVFSQVKTVTVCGCDVLTLKFGYSLYSLVEGLVRKSGGMIKDSLYGEQVGFTVYLPRSITKEFIRAYTEISSGAAFYEITGSAYINKTV